MIRKSCSRLAKSSKDIFNPYDVLGVPPTASKEEIKRAYYQMALRYHPDSGAGGGSSEKFKAAQEAYDLLKQGKSWHAPHHMENRNENSSTFYGYPSYTYEKPGTADKGYVSGKTEVYLRAFMVLCFLYIFIVFFFKSKTTVNQQHDEGPLSVHQED